MNNLNATPKARSRSIIKPSTKLIRKTFTGENLDRAINQVHSVVKVYGYSPSMKKCKSSRFSNAIIYAQSQPRTPKTRHINNQAEISKTEIIFKNQKASLGENEKFQYEILKARSDRIEVVRDLATFDFNFIENFGIRKKVADIKYLAERVRKSFDQYGNVENNIEDLVGKIESFVGYSWENNTNVGDFATGEKFGVLECGKGDRIQKFNGVYCVSGLECMVFAKSYLESFHLIRCLLPTNEVLITQVKSDLEIYTHQQGIAYKSAFKAHILPHLYILASKKSLELCFDHSCNVKFASFLIKLNEKNQLFTIFVKEIEDKLHIELAAKNVSIIIDKSSLEIPSISQKKYGKLLKEMKKHLFYQNKSLIWADNCFSLKESRSKFLKEKFLADAFNHYLRKIFLIRLSYKEKIFKIEGVECEDKKALKITHLKTVAEFNENTSEYKFIFDMQSMSFYSDFVTISKSLEMRFLIKKLFDI